MSIPTPINSLRTSLPGELRLAPHAPSPGWHASLLLLLLSLEDVETKPKARSAVPGGQVKQNQRPELQYLVGQAKQNQRREVQYLVDQRFVFRLGGLPVNGSSSQGGPRRGCAILVARPLVESSLHIKSGFIKALPALLLKAACTTNQALSKRCLLSCLKAACTSSHHLSASRPYQFAQNKPAWQTQTCSTRT